MFSDSEFVVPPLPIGAHLVSHRGIYVHHGVSVGPRSVVERSKDGQVRLLPIEAFSAGWRVRIRRHAWSFPPAVAAERAQALIGDKGPYDLFANNCEHFATWCLTGRPQSRQVNVATGIAVALLSAAALGLLAACGRR